MLSVLYVLCVCVCVCECVCVHVCVCASLYTHRHAPWKLMRVIPGHQGWVRAVAVDVSNEWFATGSADRTIKVHTIHTLHATHSLICVHSASMHSRRDSPRNTTSMHVCVFVCVCVCVCVCVYVCIDLGPSIRLSASHTNRSRIRCAWYLHFEPSSLPVLMR